MFHILRGPDAVGAVWAAQRVPDGGVAAVANAFTLRALAFDDAENFRVSANARDAAQAQHGLACAATLTFHALHPNLADATLLTAPAPRILRLRIPK